jgi:TonB family protein
MTITIGKATNHKAPRGAALALLIAGALLLPEVALADDDERRAGHITDSSNDRVPAVTAFPKYPSIARRDRMEGEATVCFTIDKRGRIIRPSVTSSTHRIFEKPAMTAIRNSSFEPLAAGEKPATPKTCRTYRFRLDPINAQNDREVTDPLAGVSATAPAAPVEGDPAR